MLVVVVVAMAALLCTEEWHRVAQNLAPGIGVGFCTLHQVFPECVPRAALGTERSRDLSLT